MKILPVLIASLLLGTASVGVQTQSVRSAATNPLPPGLIRQGGVVMMQPIADSDERYSAPTDFGGERGTALFHFLGSADRALLNRAVDEAQRENWPAARSVAAQVSDPAARLVIEWAYLRDRNSGAPFAEIAQFLKDHPDWPGRETLLARGEEMIGYVSDPHAVIAWFGDRTPETGIGKVRLGEALIAAGSPERGRALIRQAWIEDSFRQDQEFYVVSQHGDALTPEAERERLERLLDDNDLSAARRQLVRVDVSAQRLANARLLLHTDPLLGEQDADALPMPLRDDPGLLFDRFAPLRQRNEPGAIPALLARDPARQVAKINPGRWWTELNLDTRAALQQGLDREAYALCADTGLPPDVSEYADAEFLAGWIALRLLAEPAIALTHFDNVIRVSSHPVSRARAHYWAARAREAVGDARAAEQEYRIAAADAASFYGQLALERLSPNALLHLPRSVIDTREWSTAYEREDLTGAVRALADLGLEGPLREFAVQDAKVFPVAGHLKLLAEDLARMGFPDVAVRVAKQASYDGVYLPDYSHPLIAVPRYAGPGIAPEDALVLAIIRQETEFDPNAVSGAGARGIMQVMPDSAPHLAELAGLSYRPSALTGDADYDIELGMTELAHQLSVWGGSYVLAAAAYNAGPGNVRKWIAAHGDPRDARIDAVDWIEQIPFGETRNYVQRVLENVEVYRNRLSGRDQTLRILVDLYRPDAPPLSPLRSTASGSVTTPSLPAGPRTGTTLVSGASVPQPQGDSSGANGSAQPASAATPRLKP